MDGEVLFRLKAGLDEIQFGTSTHKVKPCSFTAVVALNPMGAGVGQ
jgi:hypothetical protein